MLNSPGQPLRRTRRPTLVRNPFLKPMLPARRWAILLPRESPRADGSKLSKNAPTLYETPEGGQSFLSRCGQRTYVDPDCLKPPRTSRNGVLGHAEQLVDLRERDNRRTVGSELEEPLYVVEELRPRRVVRVSLVVDGLHEHARVSMP